MRGNGDGGHYRRFEREMQEERGRERGDGERRGERWVGIYANPCPFHRDWTGSVSNKLLQKRKMDSEKNPSHVFTTSPILTSASGLKFGVTK